MGKRNDAFYALIKDYVANQKTLTDDQAASMLKRWAELQLEAAQIRQKYIPIVEKLSRRERQPYSSRSIAGSTQ